MLSAAQLDLVEEPASPEVLLHVLSGPGGGKKTKEDRTWAAFRNGVRRFGSILLRAKNADDLEERIGNVVWDTRYHRFHDYLNRAWDDEAEGSPDVTSREFAGFYTSEMGTKYLPLCQRWAQLSTVAIESIERLKKYGLLAVPKNVSKTGAGLIFDVAAPRFYVKAILGNLQSTVCQFAIFRYILTQDSAPLDSWKTDLLLKNVCEGLERYVQWLATIPGTDVPEGIVPRAEGVTWDALVHEWDAARERLDQSEDEESEQPPLADAGPPAPSNA